MEIPVFLAMTAAEVAQAEELPERLGWMACHFSAYGTGISNIPRKLPPGSMLMLNDRTPVCGHAPDGVAKALCEAADRLQCRCILLDFQRGDMEALLPIIRAVLDRAGCPVGVSALYALELDCPVLVPPVEPYKPLEEALSPWDGREIWMELSTEAAEITVTNQGSRYAPLPFYEPPENAHYDEGLCCHYEIQAAEKEVRFLLGRTEADLQASLDKAKDFNVTQGIRLWQEIKQEMPR